MLTDNTRLNDKEGDRLVTFPSFDPQLTLTFTSLDTLPFRDVVLETPILMDEGFSYDLLDHDTAPTSMALSGIKADELSSKIEFSLVLDLQPGTYVIHFFPFIRFSSRHIEFDSRCGTTGDIDVSFLLPTEKIINYDILTDENKIIDDELWDGKADVLFISSYYFKVVE